MQRREGRVKEEEEEFGGTQAPQAATDESQLAAAFQRGADPPEWVM